MPNRRPILIVEDDETLRNMLAEYLDETNEFVVTTAADIEAADKLLGQRRCAFRCDDPRHRPARWRRARLLRAAAPGGTQHADHHADRRDRGDRRGPRPRFGRRATTSPSRSAPASCWPACVRSCAIFDRSEQVVFPVGPYTFRPAKKLLQDAAKNRRIRLTDKETAVLKYLYRSDAAVNRQILMHEVWGYNSTVTTPHAGDAHLSAAPEDRGGSGAIRRCW